MDFCKIINPEISIHRDHLIETSFSTTFYNKQINAKKYEWKFGSVQIVMARQCRVCERVKAMAKAIVPSKKRDNLIFSIIFGKITQFGRSNYSSIQNCCYLIHYLMRHHDCI